jgi:hypothetical protein
VRSRINARCAGTSRMDRTGESVRISPPPARTMAARLSVIVLEPPRASGHPVVWASAPSASATPAVGERSSGRIEWAAIPASSALARSLPTGSRPTLRTASRPIRASRSERRSAPPSRTNRRNSSSIPAVHRVSNRRYCASSGPSPAADSSMERVSSTGGCPSSGCASEMSGSIQSTSRSSFRKQGEATARGWIAEHTS